MKKKTRIELMKVSMELAIASLNKQQQEISDEKVIETFQKCYQTVVDRFLELEKLTA